MLATCHRVVGIVDVEDNPDFLLQLEAPIGATVFEDRPRNLGFHTCKRLTAEIQQLAADLKIEFERYQRQSLVCSEA